MSDFRLKVFRSVAKNLSFTKASQELFVSQPAITKHIQELEAAYQTRLFDRQGSRISLTESGNLLLEHCERILEDYKRLEYEMHLLHNEYTGGLKLGASTTIAQYVLPPLLASFIGKFPQVSLSLLNGNSREIEAALQEHRIDLGFAAALRFAGRCAKLRIYRRHRSAGCPRTQGWGAVYVHGIPPATRAYI